MHHQLRLCIMGYQMLKIHFRYSLYKLICADLIFQAKLLMLVSFTTHIVLYSFIVRIFIGFLNVFGTILHTEDKSVNKRSNIYIQGEGWGALANNFM